MTSCAWCSAPFTPNPPGHGRPKVYCAPACRRLHGRYVESLPGWQARLAELEAAAVGYGTHVPTFLRNELDALRAAIAAGPVQRSNP